MNIDKIIQYLEDQKSRNELKTINGTRYIKDIEWYKTINRTLNYINRSVKRWKNKTKKRPHTKKQNGLKTLSIILISYWIKNLRR